MMRKLNAAALPAALAAAAIIINTVCIQPLPAAAAGPSDEPESEEAYITAKPEEDSGIRREKYYLLQAMDQLENMGISPIAVWAEVTKDEKVLDTVKDIGQTAADTVADAVSEKVSEAGDAVADKVQEAGDAAADQAKNAAKEEVRKAKKSLFAQLKEWIQKTLGSGRELEHEQDF